LLRFPIIALAVALIAIGRGPTGEFFDMDRRRDRIARNVLLVTGVLILVVWFVL
jgi:hypothetical protein